MSTTEHTPGPWEKYPATVTYGDERYGVQSKAGPLVCDCGIASNPYSEANARLIAAAPELLEALKLAIYAVTEIDNSHKSLRTIRAAIAKAEGRP